MPTPFGDFAQLERTRSRTALIRLIARFLKGLEPEEVAVNELQRTPHYPSGIALRFARITRPRDEKSPRDATTIQELRKLYDQQFKFKGKVEGEEERCQRPGW